MDISLQPVESWQAEDRSWLGSRDGTDVTQTVTLDTSTFNANTHYPNGYIPSGVILGRITATDLYGPYTGKAIEVQTISLGAASAGTITIGFDGAVSTAIAFNATAATVLAALEAMATINPGDVAVTGGPLPGAITLTFGGRYVGRNVPDVVVTPTGLTGGAVSVATSTAGGSATGDGRETPVGFLYSNTKVRAGGPNVGAPIHWRGVIRAVRLPIAPGSAGGLDAAARADLAAKFWIR